MLDDPKYSSLEACLKNSTELIHIIQDRIKLKSSAEWLSEFQKLDIPCNLLTSFRDVEYNEQAWANDMIERFQTPNGKQCIFPCNPIRMCSQEVFRSTPGPMLGEHTEDILKEMGYSDSAIAELLSSGAAVQYQGR